MALKPLPTELAEESKCSYCGVSYLIMHEIEGYQATIRELQERLKIHEIRQSSQQLLEKNSCESIEELALINQQLNVQLKDLSEEGTKYRSEILDLEKQVEVQSNGLEGVLLDIKSIRDCIEKQNMETSRLTTLFDIDDEVVQHVKDFEELKARELSELRLVLTAITEELKASEETAVQLTEINTALSCQLGKLEVHCAAIEEENTQLKESSNETQIRLEQTSEDLNNAKIAEKELSLENEELKMAVQQANNQITKLSEEITQTTSKYLQQIRETERLQLLGKQMQDRLAEIENSKMDEASVQREQFRIEMAQKEDIIDRLKAELVDKLQEIEEFKAEIEQESKNSSVYAEEYRKQRDAAAALAERLEHNNFRFEHVRKELLSFSKAITVLEDQSSQLRESQRTHTSEFTAALIQLAAVIDTGISTLSRQIKEWEARYSVVNQEKADALKTNERLNLEKENLQKQLSDALQHSTVEASDVPDEGRMDELLTENDTLKTKIINLQQTVFHECKERNDLMRTLNQLRTQVTQIPAKSSERGLK